MGTMKCYERAEPFQTDYPDVVKAARRIVRDYLHEMNGGVTEDGMDRANQAKTPLQGAF